MPENSIESRRQINRTIPVANVTEVLEKENNLMKCKKSGSEVIKLFSCSIQMSMKIIMLINVKMLTIVAFSYLLA